MADEQVGAIIEGGVNDWQIVQRDAQGEGEFHPHGRWVSQTAGQVQVRLVFEETGVAVRTALDWQPAETRPDGTWSARLSGVPAGGLYRLETRLTGPDIPAAEWSPRGDMRHFLGVGELWVIAGQSNSAGYGRGPYFDPPELGVHLFGNSERWALASHPMNESTDTRHPCNREGGNPGHSPYLHFGRVLQQGLGCPVGLVQTSLGGSPLTLWNPTEPGESFLYHNMLHCVSRAGGKVRGVLWYQGESDTGPEQAESYADRFVSAVQSWRSALGNEDLAILTVQLNRVLNPPEEEGDRRWTILREAQRQVCRRLPGVFVVPTLDLSLSDGIHTSPAGNMLIGERLARAALGGVFGKAVDFRAPEIRTARSMADGKTVELIFEPLTSRIGTIDGRANPFRIEDVKGLLPIERVEYPDNETVRLALSRPIAGQAVVHGGYGMDPKTVPMDVERAMPMLGFYGVTVCEG